VSAEITIAMSFNDYLAANRLIMREKWNWRRSLRYVLLVGAFYAAIISICELSEYGFSFAGVLVCFLLGLVFGLFALLAVRVWLLWCIPRSAKKLYEQQPSASAPYLFTFDAQGIKAVGPYESSNLPWSHFRGWLESEHQLILCKTAITFFCLPKRQLGEDNAAELKKCLESVGIKMGI